MNTQEFIDKWTDHPGEREVIARDIEALVAAQLTALTAERDSLRALVVRLEKECEVMRAVLGDIVTSPEWELNQSEQGEQGQ